jgi:hypothetical protein
MHLTTRTLHFWRPSFSMTEIRFCNLEVSSTCDVSIKELYKRFFCDVLSASHIRRISLFEHKKNDVPASFHSSIEISVISYIVRFLTHKYDYYSDYLELLGTGGDTHEQVQSRLG